jgi:hypothetical protein
VLILCLILLLTWLVLAALLWGGSRWIQGALYERIPPDLIWRAPAAAAAVTAFLLIWAMLNSAALGPGDTELPYNTLLQFSSERLSEPVAEMTVERADAKVIYKKVSLPTTPPTQEYRDADHNQFKPERVHDAKAITVKDGENEVRFLPDPNEQRFKEEKGRRYLSYESFGRITTPRTGATWLMIVLNLLHLAIWFVVVWLLLRFEWPHALVGAVALWAAMTMLVPSILDRVPRKPPVSRQVATLSAACGFALAQLRGDNRPVLWREREAASGGRGC